MSDPLSTLLRVAGVQGSLVSRARVGAPYGLSTDGTPKPVFHTPLSGEALLVADGVCERLSPGHVAVIAAGTPHTLCDREGRLGQPVSAFQRESGVLPTLVNGRPPEVDLLCGMFQLGEPAHTWILGALPPVFVVHPEPALGAALSSTLALLETSLQDGLGRELLTEHMLHVLVVHLVRQGPVEAGWFAGIADPHLGPVLVTVLTEPTGDWPVERMASLAGMSRTRFCEHFRRVLGQSPGAWWLSWRLAVGRRALASGRDVSNAATAAGYASEAAFSRAFKRSTGISPGAWRALAS